MSRRDIIQPILQFVRRVAARDDSVVFGRMGRSVSLVRETRGDYLLDIGCGNGWLARAAGADHRYIGIDVAWQDGPPAELTVVQADARALPFADECFDIVTIFEVIEHVPAGTEPAVLREVRRVLRPGGMLLLSTPNGHAAATLLDPAWWLRGHRHYHADSLARLLGGTGFTDLTLWILGGLREALYVPFFYLFKRLRLRVPFESSWRSGIDHEYWREGWYTIFARARVPADQDE